MKQISCKAVHVWDGGSLTHFAFHIASSVSDKDIEAHTPHCSIIKVVLTVFDSLEEKIANSRVNLRKSAWAKLSISEREALGMVEEPK